MKKIGVLLAILLVLGFLGDLAVRSFYLPRYWRPLPPFGAITNDRQAAWLERQQRELREGVEESTGIFHAELGWINRAETVGENGHGNFNSRAMRGRREYSERPAAGITRLATFGDSFTFCQEVSDDETWQALLEEISPSVEALNLGVGGYGTDQALLRAKRDLPGLNADVAMLGLMLENIGRNVNRYRSSWYPKSDVAVAKPRFILRDGALQLIPLPFKKRAQLIEAIADGSVVELLEEHEFWDDPYVPDFLRWSATARLLGARSAYAARDLAPLYRDTEAEPFQVTVALLEEFIRFARECGVERPVVVIFAMELDLRDWMRSGERYWVTLFEELDRRGIPYIDATAPVGERYGKEEGLFVGAHHSRAGNLLVAELLQDWLLKTAPASTSD